MEQKADMSRDGNPGIAPRNLALVLLVTGLAMFSGQAGATNYNDTASDFWNNSATWISTPPGGTYPRFAGDAAVIDSFKVTVSSIYSRIAISNITISGSGSSVGELAFGESWNTGTITNESPITLAGGGVISRDRNTTVHLNGKITVTGGTNVINSGASVFLSINGGVENTTGSGKIVKVGSKYDGGGLMLSSASPAYSNGWDIKEGAIFVTANGALGAGGVVTVGGLGGANDAAGASTPELQFRLADCTGVKGPASINVNSNDNVGGNAHLGSVAGYDPGLTTVVDFLNDPVSTFNNGAWELRRSAISWYDPVHVVGTCYLWGMTSGELHLFGPLSCADTNCVFCVNHHSGNTSSLRGNNSNFTGRIYVTAGKLQTYHTNALGNAHTLEVDNQGLFDPWAMPGTGAPRPHIIIRPGGVYGNRYNDTMLNHTMDIELAGGSIVFGDHAVDVSGKILISADSLAQTVYQILTLSGEISGPGRLTGNCGGNGCSIYLTNLNNTNGWTGGIYATACTGNGALTIRTPGAQGAGPISGSAGTAGRVRFQNAAGASDWTVSNTLCGNGMIQVEDGSSDHTLYANGTVVPGSTNMSGITTSDIGWLSVTGKMAFARQGTQSAQFKVKIAGTNNVAGTDYDRLVISRECGDLVNANLIVNISTNIEPAALAGQVFTILTSANDLAGQCFNSVGWNESVLSPRGKWRGDVTYGFDSGNGYVRLSNLRVIASGTLIVLQ